MYVYYIYSCVYLSEGLVGGISGPGKYIRKRARKQEVDSWLGKIARRGFRYTYCTKERSIAALSAWLCMYTCA